MPARSFHRIVTATITQRDGSQQDVRHESIDDPDAITRFITSFPDDQPGQPVTFTITSQAL